MFLTTPMELVFVAALEAWIVGQHYGMENKTGHSNGLL